MHVSAALLAPHWPVHKVTPSDNTERTARSGTVVESIFCQDHGVCSVGGGLWQTFLSFQGAPSGIMKQINNCHYKRLQMTVFCPELIIWMTLYCIIQATGCINVTSYLHTRTASVHSTNAGHYTARNQCHDLNTAQHRSTYQYKLYITQPHY